MLFLIDLDGTLVNSDHLHYEAYAKSDRYESGTNTGNRGNYWNDKFFN